MKTVVIRGGRVVTPVETRFADVLIKDNLIQTVGNVSSTEYEEIDASGCWVTPGLIDLQVNGGPECSFWEMPTMTQLKAFLGRLAANGVTTILPTLITGAVDKLQEVERFFVEQAKVSSAELSASAPANEIRLPALHLEGPCLSPQRPGVHPPEHLQPLSVDVLKKIVNDAVGLITLAPELDHEGAALDFLHEKKVVTALGHSNATFEEANKAFAHGVGMMTHTFNALPPIHHRNPGAVTAALLDSQVTCCVICDGQHLAPPAVQLVVKMKGVSKTILVTDIARVGTSQGGLVGSSILLNEAVKNIVNWGVCSFPEAIRMATINPATSMGWEKHIGHLDEGKQADIVVWNQADLSIKRVFVAGRAIP